MTTRVTEDAGRERLRRSTLARACTPLTKSEEKRETTRSLQLELARVQVTGVDCNSICHVKIASYWSFNTSVYSAVQIYLISSETVK